MVDALLKPRIAFVVALMLGALAGCSFYSPTIADCAISCTEGGACPRGTTCRNGFCRLESAMGECACKLGDTRACGGGRGECKPGTEVCTSERVWSGVCTGEGRPTMETCNNKDDDCNGLIDDNVTDSQACSLTQGVCAGKRTRCESGSQLTCEPTDYGPSFQQVESRCDGLDNDCDGFTDVRAATVLTTEAAPTGPFLFVKLVQGFALVFERRPSGSPSELLVSRFDDQFAFVRSTLVSRPAPATFHARSLGDFVFVASSVDGGVFLSRVDTNDGSDAGVVRFESLLDGGFSEGLRLGVAEQAVSTYLAAGSTRARMLVWQLDGGLAQVRDLNDGPGVPATVTLNSVNVSDRGHYVIYSADDSAANTVRELLRLGDGGVWNPPFYGGVEAELIEWDAGVSSTYPYVGSTVSGIYCLPDLTQGVAEVTVAASPVLQQWGAMATVRTQSGVHQVVMQERPVGSGQQLVVASSFPNGDSISFRPRNLDGGAGVPQLVPASDPAWLLVGWREGTSIRARRVCSP